MSNRQPSNQNHKILWLAAGFFGLALSARALAAAPFPAVETGASVVVVYNSRMPASKGVAEYYAQRRQVPASQVFGFDLPSTESMTREEFIQKLQLPLWRKLEAGKLFVLGPVTNSTRSAGIPAGWPVTNSAGNAGIPAGGGSPVSGQRRVVSATFRYLALCYGVPTRVLRSTNLVEPGQEKIQELLRRNEASVDSDLACLPITEQNLIWTGPIINPFYSVTNAGLLQPTSGILMVTRLDGPTPEIARGLVDKAMEAETNGLWGRAYFDARGITEGGYKQGDDWMRAAARLTQTLGFETELDEHPKTFSVGHPMSHIAFYAGWYDEHVSGPFTRPQVEFMPGAFAYHLHSFSAQVLRTTNRHWAGPLLAKGATITVGSVDEPYLIGTLDVGLFLSRMILFAFSFGEAAYASQSSVSWQNIALGDPLYRPFGRHPALIQADLERRASKLVESCHCRLLNLQQAAGADPEDLILKLEGLPITTRSAVLTEKLANLCWKAKRLSEGIDTYEKALNLSPSPQQRVRLLLTLAEKRTFYGPDQLGYEAYQRFLREVPDYPDVSAIYEKLQTLAQKLGRQDEAQKWAQALERLNPKPVGVTNSATGRKP